MLYTCWRLNGFHFDIHCKMYNVHAEDYAFYVSDEKNLRNASSAGIMFYSYTCWRLDEFSVIFVLNSRWVLWSFEDLTGST